MLIHSLALNPRLSLKVSIHIAGTHIILLLFLLHVILLVYPQVSRELLRVLDCKQIDAFNAQFCDSDN